MVTRGVDPERPLCGACGKVPVQAGRMACSDCWRLVPRPLQLAVFRAWAEWKLTMTDDQWADYMTARKVALAAIA